MKKYSIEILCFLFVTTLSTANATDIYVSPSGSDTNSGQANEPLASLSAAQQQARLHMGQEAVTVHVANGIYYLPKTLIFTPEDSGTEQYPVLYKADKEGSAILSGGSKLNLSWKPYKNGIFQAETPADLIIDQVFIDGTNQRMARYPNYDTTKKTEPYQGFAADAFSKERAASWSDPTDGYIHAMHRSSWGGYHYKITGKNPTGEVTYEGGWQNNRKSKQTSRVDGVTRSKHTHTDCQDGVDRNRVHLLTESNPSKLQRNKGVGAVSRSLDIFFELVNKPGTHARRPSPHKGGNCTGSSCDGQDDVHAILSVLVKVPPVLLPADFRPWSDVCTTQPPAMLGLRSTLPGLRNA